MVYFESRESICALLFEKMCTPFIRPIENVNLYLAYFQRNVMQLKTTIEIDVPKSPEQTPNITMHHNYFISLN